MIIYYLIFYEYWNCFFTFQISNTFEEWAKIFDSPEIDEFHKNVWLSFPCRGKGLEDPKEVIIIYKPNKESLNIYFWTLDNKEYLS